MNWKIYPTSLMAAFLVACGGGGGGGGSNTGGPGGSTTLKPTAYSVFKHGQLGALSGAGAVSSATTNGGTLSLGADGNTALAVTDANTFAMTASNTNFQVVNRRNGAVLMLCDPLPAGGKPGDTFARYVAFATNSATADTQGTPVTNAVELAGKSLYAMNECSYSNDGSIPQGQERAPNGNTLEYRVDAAGNVRGTNGAVWDAATITGFLNGTPLVFQGRNIWFSAYKFTVGGEQKIYFALRGEPNSNPGNQGFVELWTDDPSSDVVGCSLNCTKPTDAVAVTSPASVPGFYLTEFGFGDEAAAVWINSSGKFSYGLATPANTAEFVAGLELGTLAFDASGTASAMKDYDTNGTGEAVQWGANSNQVVSTAVSDPSRHFILQRIEKDPTNLLLGAWALTTCGTTTGISATDPTQAFAIVFLKSGHYMTLDSFGDLNNTSPLPGVEYGTFTQNSAAGTFQYTGNLFDTNAEAGTWSPNNTAPIGDPRQYTISADGNTMSITATGDLCGMATLTRIN